MTIQYRDGNVHKNADGLSRWALPNDPNNPDYDQDDVKFPIMGIITAKGVVLVTTPHGNVGRR